MGTKRKKVLIADDEPDVRALVFKMLSRDMDVIQASDGAQAIDLAQSEAPDLILMDIIMPQKDGYSACMSIKSNPKSNNQRLALARTKTPAKTRPNRKSTNTMRLSAPTNQPASRYPKPRSTLQISS